VARGHPNPAGDNSVSEQGRMVGDDKSQILRWVHGSFVFARFNALEGGGKSNLSKRKMKRPQW